jgi:hypothetical protein
MPKLSQRGNQVIILDNQDQEVLVINPIEDQSLPQRVFVAPVVADGVADDTAVIQNTLTEAALAGGGTVILPAGVIKTTDTLYMQADPVRLVGIGITHSIYNFGTFAGTTLKYSGTAGTGRGTKPMLRIETPSTLIGGPLKKGIQVEGIHFDCNNLASDGIVIRSVWGGKMDEVEIRNPRNGGFCLDLGTYAIDTVSGTNCNCHAWEFGTITLHADSGQNGGLMILDSIQQAGSLGNTSECHFRRVYGYHHDGPGVIIADADSNTIDHLALNVDGTGLGLEFKGASTASGFRSRDNRITFCQVGGGIVARATGLTVPSGPNVIGFNREIELVSIEPVIEPGAQLTIIEANGRLENIWPGLRRTTEIHDEFMGGGLTTGTIGELGWSIFGGVLPTVGRTVAGSLGAPGTLRIGTGAVASNYVGFALNGATTSSDACLNPADFFQLLFRLLMVDIGGSVQARIGFLALNTPDPPADGIYFEKLITDTQWFPVCRAAGVQTRGGAGQTVDSAFHRFQIRRKDPSTIAFSMDQPDNYPTETTINTNIPTALLTPCITVKNDAGAVTKRFDIDSFRLRVNGLSR